MWKFYAQHIFLMTTSKVLSFSFIHCEGKRKSWIISPSQRNKTPPQTSQIFNQFFENSKKIATIYHQKTWLIHLFVRKPTIFREYNWPSWIFASLRAAPIWALPGLVIVIFTSTLYLINVRYEILCRQTDWLVAEHLSSKSSHEDKKIYILYAWKNSLCASYIIEHNIVILFHTKQP